MASEDFRQTATVVPSPPLPSDKVALRRIARLRRREFVETIDRARRDSLETALADQLAPLINGSRIVGGYAALSDEISLLPALANARARGATIAFPAFAAAHEPFRFLAGDPVEPGPFATLQPPSSAPIVFPDLVLVPLVAVDNAGNRIGQGKGHYDRVLGELRWRGARLIGIGWAVQLLDVTIATEPWDVPLDGFASPEGVTMWR